MDVELVLVHSPLVGPCSWTPLGRLLHAGGGEVVIPDLRATVASATPPYWTPQVEIVADAARGGPAVLVGHSGAGALLAGAGARLEDVRGYLFVDAVLPSPGESWMETVPAELASAIREKAVNRWVSPWPEWWQRDELASLVPDDELLDLFVADCPRLPLALFEEQHGEAAGWPDAPCAYLSLSDAYGGEVAHATSHGWPTRQLGRHHLSIYSEPETVLGPMLELLEELAGASS